MRRRFRIVGKQFEFASLKQAVESIDTSENPSNLKPELETLLELAYACLDDEGKFCPTRKANDLWHLAHFLALDLGEYREKITKLEDAVQLLVDQCPDEWYDSED